VRKPGKTKKLLLERIKEDLKEECQALLGSSDGHLKPILITALNTGMRKGEILSLRWDENIDLRHGFILLDRTKNGERREIPINATLRATLQGLTRRLDVPYVFLTPQKANPTRISSTLLLQHAVGQGSKTSAFTI